MYFTGDEKSVVVPYTFPNRSIKYITRHRYEDFIENYMLNYPSTAFFSVREDLGIPTITSSVDGAMPFYEGKHHLSLFGHIIYQTHLGHCKWWFTHHAKIIERCMEVKGGVDLDIAPNLIFALSESHRTSQMFVDEFGVPTVLTLIKTVTTMESKRRIKDLIEECIQFHNWRFDNAAHYCRVVQEHKVNYLCHRNHTDIDPKQCRTCDQDHSLETNHYCGVVCNLRNMQDYILPHASEEAE